MFIKLIKIISNNLWRILVIVTIVAIVSLGYKYEQDQLVDTEAMLNVSVSIKTVSYVHTDSVGDSVWMSGAGSGFLIDARKCEVLTNQHVINNAAIIEVFPRGWKATRGIPARVVNSSPHADIALLKMESCDSILQARIGDSGAVRAGDETFVVGNPFGQNPDSISRGIISNTKRYMRDASPYLQTDAIINPGNSGGALFNHKGEVIGINTAIATTGAGVNTGIGYAIPINYANMVVSDLRNGNPSWGDAGINQYLSSLGSDEAAFFGVPKGYTAVILTETPSKGAAAGKLFARDVIYRIDNRSVESSAHARRVINRLAAGQAVNFNIVRDAQPIEVSITLDDGWRASEPQPAEYYPGYLGMTLEMWSDKNDVLSQIKTPVIARVQNLGPAHKALISSSQRAIARIGPMWATVVLYVKTITGVVIDGQYHSVRNIESVQEYARNAYIAKQSLLLEVQIWYREDPMDIYLPLEPDGKSFYKITPKKTTAPKPVEKKIGVADE